jgi:hypothetical protein
MRPEKKRDYRQQRLAFANQALWERLPELHRVRCCELMVELLRGVIFVDREPGREHERED